MEKELLEFIENETGFRNHPITNAIKQYFLNLRQKTELRQEKVFKQIQEEREQINRLIP